MCDLLISLFAGLASIFRTRASLHLEILALRHQLGVLQRTERRGRIGRLDIPREIRELIREMSTTSILYVERVFMLS
jgi:hypothetical protein